MLPLWAAHLPLAPVPRAACSGAAVPVAHAVARLVRVRVRLRLRLMVLVRVRVRVRVLVLVLVRVRVRVRARVRSRVSPCCSPGWP